MFPTHFNRQNTLFLPQLTYYDKHQSKDFCLCQRLLSTPTFTGICISNTSYLPVLFPVKANKPDCGHLFSMPPMKKPASMTKGMTGADISSLLYVKSNTFKIKKETETKKKKASSPATLLN